MAESYWNENKINKLQKEFEEAWAKGDYELADKINTMLERESQMAIAVADAKLRDTLKRHGLR